jgi:beta-1,4-mannosyl-glycoprotein beta-1,4-N-acetylglucosaminyltransferase
MKIIDCTTFFNEPLLFDIRLNVLNEYVDKFIVCEATFTHSGNKKKINFDKNLFPKFKHKIEHIIVDDEPDGLKKIEPISDKNNSFYRLNAAKRIEHQRNQIANLLKDLDLNDWIFYSDSDEIPNFANIDLKSSKFNYVFFNQKVFYYKFNLILPSHDWFGSKGCKVKNFSSISNLRNLKTKKYNWWRLDTIFKKDKIINVKIIENGGWHFTEIKTPEEIYLKHKNDEHHDEFDLTGISSQDIEKMVKNNYITYDHKVDGRNLEKKWNKNNRIKLIKVDESILPNYLRENKTKFKKWFS